MANLTASNIGSNLMSILGSDDIEPGSDPSYQLCKQIFLYHPLGAKMASAPITMAQSQQRRISVPKGPEERVREQFNRQWAKDRADEIIANVATQSRIYGISSLVYGAEGVPSNEAIDPWQLPNLKIYFNVLDPLNTAGSLFLSQDPNSPDFQKYVSVSSNGQAYHRSRCVVILNEQPIYIAYTGSAFGYVGRSVYQRALFPLKSFISSMIADDMVARKAGLLVAKLKQPGPIINKLMAGIASVKRALLMEGQTNNVLNISIDEAIETLNMQNVADAMGAARKNILENTAVSADMPAKMLNSETFAEGFGEGTEDAKNVARFVARCRVWMQPLYEYFDTIIQYRAWNPEFYSSIQAEFPDEYGSKDYKTAFFEWVNSFTAEWPNLLEEPDSEKIKVEEVKFKAVCAVAEILFPVMDPQNKGVVVQWIQDNFNNNKMLFQNPLDIDTQGLADYMAEREAMEDASIEDGDGDEIEDEREPRPPRPMHDADIEGQRNLVRLVDRLVRWRLKRAA